MANFDYELLAEIAEEAPAAGGNASWTNYGRVWMDNLQVSHWDNDSKSFVKRPYESGKLEKGETIEFQLHQDIKEFNPALNFDKTWYVQVRNSGKGKKNKTDWGEIIHPSIEKVFKTLGAFFKAMSGNGVYCAVEDFNTDRQNAKGYDITAPKFVTVYKNKAECEKARAAVVKKSESFPPEPSEKVVNEFKGAVDALGGVDAAREQLPEYEGYSFDELVKAAGLQERQKIFQLDRSIMGLALSSV